MKRTILSTVFLGLVTFFLGGCGSSLRVIKPAEAGMVPQGADKTFEVAPVQSAEGADIPEHILLTIEDWIEKAIKNAGMASNPGGGLLIQVEVKGFRKREKIMREYTGIFAGPDWVEAQVRVLDRQFDKAIGEASILSFNITTYEVIQTVFSQKIVEYLKGLGAEKVEKPGRHPVSERDVSF